MLNLAGEKKRLARLKSKGPKSAVDGLETNAFNSQPCDARDAPLEESVDTARNNEFRPMQPTEGVFSAIDDVEEIIRNSGDVGQWDLGQAGSMPFMFTSAESLPNFGITDDTSWSAFTSPNGTIAPALLDSLSTTSPSSTNPYSMSSSTNSPPNDEFPDSYLLPVHELTLLKGFLRIAERLGCTGTLWQIETLSPFNLNTAPAFETLPEVWRPTSAQIMVPHHPLIDFLPWPSVRDRILAIMSMPSESRPPAAAGDLWLYNLAYDVEDNAEGIRIYGGDPYDPESWEVGQKLFENWWFVFDRKVVERSNKWRKLRGAPLLTAKSSTTES